MSWQNSRMTDFQYKYRTSLDSSHAQDSEKVRYAHSRRNLEKQVLGIWQRYSKVESWAKGVLSLRVTFEYS